MALWVYLSLHFISFDISYGTLILLTVGTCLVKPLKLIKITMGKHSHKIWSNIWKFQTQIWTFSNNKYALKAFFSMRCCNLYLGIKKKNVPATKSQHNPHITNRKWGPEADNFPSSIGKLVLENPSVNPWVKPCSRDERCPSFSIRCWTSSVGLDQFLTQFITCSYFTRGDLGILADLGGNCFSFC